MKARRSKDGNFKVMEKNSQPRILFSAKPSFNNGEIKAFLDKQQPREHTARRPVLQEIAKGVLQAEMKGQ